MSLIPADRTLTSPWSKSGESVPGSLGPLGNSPTHKSPPASKPRYQVSPSEASDTPGASGFGAENSTRRHSEARAIAPTATPAATANAPIGWGLKDPKNVRRSQVKVASSGTPSTASPALTISQVTIG